MISEQKNVRYSATGTRFTLVTDDDRLEVDFPIHGNHMVLNGLMAVAAGKACGLTLEECVTGLVKAQLTKGRLELKFVGGLSILDDSYNANPESMVAALQTLARMPSPGRRIAVLGKMGELGAQSAVGYRRVGEAAVESQVDQLLTIGTETEVMAQAARSAGSTNALTLPSVEEAAKWLKQFAMKDDLVLLKGSRSAEMERVLTSLEALDFHQEYKN